MSFSFKKLFMGACRIASKPAVVPALRMKAVRGAVEFKYAQFAQPLAYSGGSSTASPPFSDFPELSATSELVSAVDVGEGVSALAANAFAGCGGLSSASFPGLVSLGAGAFAGTGLSQFDLAWASSVPENAFQNCTGLTSVSCSVSEIGPGAFRQCRALERVVFGETPEVPAVSDTSFSGRSGAPAVSCIVPFGMYREWSSNQAWAARVAAGEVVLVRADGGVGTLTYVMNKDYVNG